VEEEEEKEETEEEERCLEVVWGGAKPRGKTISVWWKKSQKDRRLGKGWNSKGQVGPTRLSNGGERVGYSRQTERNTIRLPVLFLYNRFFFDEFPLLQVQRCFCPSEFSFINS
jgi:hypothetical protein